MLVAPVGPALASVALAARPATIQKESGTAPASATAGTDPVTAALLLESQGQVAKALALLRRAATGSASVRSELHLAAARMLARHGDFAEALAEGHAGIAAKPTDGFSYIEVAKILDQSGRHAEAIALAQEAARKDPQVRFAASDLIFQIQTHWGSMASSPPAPPPSRRRSGFPRWAWLALGAILAVGILALAVWRRMRVRAGDRLWASGHARTLARTVEQAVASGETEPEFSYGRQLAPGERIGPYRIVRLVSSSLHSSLYQAEDLKLHRPVALKQANPLGIQSRAALERFHKEVQSLIALSGVHRGVVKVYDYLPPATLVTEWIEGANLEDAVGALGVDRLLEIAIELCDILAEAHAMAIIHRDIKPSNVMVSNSGEVKLLDFGIAKNAALGTSQLTADSGVPLGTFTYMAPEQFASPHQARPESDLYSLGLSLYRLITGSLPASPWLGPRTFGFVAAGSFLPVTEAAPAIRSYLGASAGRSDLAWIADLDRILSRSFREDPGERFKSAAELKAELERVLAALRASKVGG